MTHKILNIFYLMILSLVFFACKKDLTTLDMSKADLKATATDALTNWTGFTKDDPNKTFISCTISPVNVGATVPLQYVIEMAITEDFTDPIALSKFTNITKDTILDILVQPVDSILQKSFKLATGKSATVYIRVRVNALNQGNQAVSDTVKNVLGNYTVGPIYKAFELLPYTLVTPNLWYLVGTMTSEPWKNAKDKIGPGLWPLSVVSGNNYDALGNGLFEASFYFTADDEFKIINVPGTWDIAYASTSGSLTTISPTGKDNVVITTSGWYKISLNTIDQTCSITPTTAPASNYNNMGMVGTINNWGNNNNNVADPIGHPDITMTAAQTTNNHIWYTTYTFVANDEVKFRADNAWGGDWGGDNFPLSVKSGGNIKVSVAGTYIVITNDIDGFFYFIKQ